MSQGYESLVPGLCFRGQPSVRSRVTSPGYARPHVLNFHVSFHLEVDTLFRVVPNDNNGADSTKPGRANQCLSSVVISWLTGKRHELLVALPITRLLVSLSGFVHPPRLFFNVHIVCRRLTALLCTLR